jgi:hypothetical protein
MDPVADIARNEIPECSDRVPVYVVWLRSRADGVASDLRRGAIRRRLTGTSRRRRR